MTDNLKSRDASASKKRLSHSPPPLPPLISAQKLQVGSSWHSWPHSCQDLVWDLCFEESESQEYWKVLRSGILEYMLYIRVKEFGKEAVSDFGEKRWWLTQQQPPAQKNHQSSDSVGPESHWVSTDIEFCEYLAIFVAISSCDDTRFTNHGRAVKGFCKSSREGKLKKKK